MGKKIKDLLISRFSEASTWRGLIMILVSLGITINPELINYIITVGTGAVGAIGVLFADKIIEEKKLEETKSSEEMVLVEEIKK